MTGIIVLLMPTSWPSKSDVDEIITQLRLESDYERRVLLTKGLLDRLCKAMTYEDNNDILHYAFDGIKTHFLTEKDVAILEGMDRSIMDGGFANNLSNLYYDLKSEPLFIARYRENPIAQKSLARCVGLGWSDVDYYEVIGKESKQTRTAKP